MTHFLSVAHKNLYLNIKREHEGEYVFRNSIDFIFLYMTFPQYNAPEFTLKGNIKVSQISRNSIDFIWNRTSIPQVYR